MCSATAVENIKDDVLAALRGAGVTASWEYPGFLRVPADAAHCWNFGTANEHWTGDLTTLDGAELRTSVDLGIPSNSFDLKEVVLAIGEVLSKRLCPTCHVPMDKVTDGAIGEWALTRYGEKVWRVRPGVYFACPTCEHCEEVTRA